MHSMGNFMLLHSAKHQARKVAKARILRALPENELVVFSHNENIKPDFVFKDRGKEIKHNGRMYDIVRREVKDGRVIYYCFDDSRETKLDELIAQATKNQNQKNKTTGHYIVLLVTTLDNVNLHLPLDYGCAELCWNPGIPALITMPSNVPTPPPDRIAA